ncbi:MAG TPA: protein kinase [Bryobacteraceae bacterium]|jgi:serine/threonine protein kinase|nr:protein kinase [Bryobacteraceae bacterium]
MSPERWQQVEQLYYAALEREPEERQGFIAEACNADTELRGELESLLAQSAAASGPLDHPPWEGTTSLLQRPGARLAPGTKLGDYEVHSLLGSGGMGEVYRAHDFRLGRRIAIKVLPVAASCNKERLKRFEQEARAAAALNHPNILSVHQMGNYQGSPYLVSELLDGETLRERLRRGRLAIGKAIDYGVQIARGLAAAHEKGIVHRDLKPENLFITQDGQVKILDFGLAKLVNSRVSSESDRPALSIATEPGVVMGTAGYMSPEQVRGTSADHRIDIFAFGAILYEMLTGKRAFQKPTAAETMSSIVNEDPSDISLTPSVPAALRRIVRRCLEKEPEQRFQSASDLAFALEALPANSEPAPSGGQASSNGWRKWLATAALVIIFFTSVWVIARHLPVRETPGVVRFSVFLPEHTRFTSENLAGPTPQIAVSPNGRMLTFVASHPAGSPLLWLRTLDSFAPQALAGTDGASFPFWSPDSRFIGFFAGGKLKKLDVTTSIAQVIADAPDGRGGTWNREGTIIFADRIQGGLKQMPAAGGTPTPVTIVDTSRGELSHRFPQFLPDGRHFLYVNRAKAQSGVYAGSLDSKETKKRVLAGRWSTVCTAGKYLLSVREGNLIAHPFNAERLEVTGEQLTVAERVASSSPSGFASFSVSLTGMLAYASGAWPSRQFAWFRRDSRQLGAVGALGEYASPALSPDERKVAVARVDSQTRTPDIWLFDLARGTQTRFTFDPGSDRGPLWSPDGSDIIFASDRAGIWNLYRKPVAGAPTEEIAIASADDEFPTHWSADARFIVYASPKPDTKWDLWALPLHEPSRPRPFLRTRFNEVQGALSPKGQWMAYSSDETGRFEVYVQSFPGGGNKWQVSVDGGSDPQWRLDGRELFYASPNHKLMSVDVRPGSRFEADVPKELFEISVPDPVAPFPNNYVVTSDGQRFLVNTVARDAVSAPISVVLNWTEELRR